tara:strand:+ start:619 stop:828 length:210 start_codon:yes stop_codon:yes gene_type:complete
MTKEKSVAGVTSDMTAEEEAALETMQSGIATSEAAQEAAEAQAVTDKTNGNQKLLDLGLSQAEVDALTK